MTERLFVVNVNVHENVNIHLRASSSIKYKFKYKFNSVYRTKKMIEEGNPAFSRSWGFRLFGKKPGFPPFATFCPVHSIHIHYHACHTDLNQRNCGFQMNQMTK